MSFVSEAYAVFLVIVFSLYWLLRKRPVVAQNTLLFVASYYFYACWDWRFLFLLAFSTLLDYASGLMIAATDNPTARKTWLWISIAINLGILAVLKYYNFFIGSFADLMGRFGVQPHFTTLQIILPVGISFYTFHGLSYIIDIYKKRIEAERNFVTYALFVSFFPLLVAGPIERANHLLPQLKARRSFDYSKAVDGLKQILWGLFKKVVIADNCAQFANQIFGGYDHLAGSTLVVGAVFFALQIYGDFSGYSDIALGTARLFGIELLRNFAFPYFSRDIAEFWRRWHISLSSWFRDYLYIPLGGSKGGMWQKVRNTFIIFLVSGLWHGANWTFIAWGALNALYFMPLLLTNRNRTHLSFAEHSGKQISFQELLGIAVTFALTVLAWIFFRSATMHDALGYLSRIFSRSLFSLPRFEGRHEALIVAALMAFFIIVEWTGRYGQHPLAEIGRRWKAPLRYGFYYLLVFALFWYGSTPQQFIYFQF